MCRAWCGAIQLRRDEERLAHIEDAEPLLENPALFHIHKTEP